MGNSFSRMWGNISWCDVEGSQGYEEMGHPLPFELNTKQVLWKETKVECSNIYIRNSYTLIRFGDLTPETRWLVLSCSTLLNISMIHFPWKHGQGNTYLKKWKFWNRELFNVPLKIYDTRLGDLVCAPDLQTYLTSRTTLHCPSLAR